MNLHDNIFSHKNLVWMLDVIGGISLFAAILYLGSGTAYAPFGLTLVITSVNFFVLARYIKLKRVWAFLIAFVFFIVFLFNIFALLLMNISTPLQAVAGGAIPILFLYYLATVFRAEKLNTKKNRIPFIFCCFAILNLVFGVLLATPAYNIIINIF